MRLSDFLLQNSAPPIQATVDDHPISAIRHGVKAKHE
jgi:hypothetical protein